MFLPFVMYGYAAALALVLLACWLIYQVIPGLRGIRTLSAAAVAAIVAVVLIGLRPWAPAFFTILIANGALLAAFGLIYLAAAHVLGERPRFLGWAIGLCLLDLPPYCYATWIHPSLVLRIWLCSGVLAIIASATAALLFSNSSSYLSRSVWTVAVFQICTASINFGRCVLSTIYPPRDFIHGDWVQTGFTYEQLIFCLGTCFGILWLSLCRNREELERTARTDSLTGLLNRRAFDEILEREFDRARFAAEGLGLILLDLDHFKSINDTYGHTAGDETLRRIGTVLLQGTRPSDTLSRYGGEEFALLLRGARPDEAQSIAERLRQSIEEAFSRSSRIQLTASVGIAIAEPDESLENLVYRCDQALYASKRAGRNRVSVGGGSAAAMVNPSNVELH